MIGSVTVEGYRMHMYALILLLSLISEAYKHITVCESSFL